MPLVMDADRMARALTRMSHEILERNRGLDEIALVGIRTRGVPLARRISRSLHDINGDDVPTGALDITCASPWVKTTTSPASSCTAAGSPTIPPQQVPVMTT